MARKEAGVGVASLELGKMNSELAKLNLELAQECELLKSDRETLVQGHQRALADAEENFNS